MCPDKSILSAWFDGEVDVQWSGEISKHLEVCNDCHTYINNLKKQRTLLQSLPTPDFEDSLEKVKARIRERRNVSGSLRFWQRKISLPVAAAAALIAATVSLGTTMLTTGKSNNVLMANSGYNNSNGQIVNLNGDKIEEILSMMESNLSDEFASKAKVEIPADFDLIFNGESQLVRTAGYDGSSIP
ncbi:MAG: hypothetical protein PF518_13600 [Spirochaetaceae bacterium]|jgi:hypothetical protein|nr:hypothetical protein [Spirochaetaceae bacterium]